MKHNIETIKVLTSSVMSRLGFLKYLRIADDNRVDLQKMLPSVILVQPICSTKLYKVYCNVPNSNYIAYTSKSKTRITKNIFLVTALTSFSNKLYIPSWAKCSDSANFSSAPRISSSVIWDPILMSVVFFLYFFGRGFMYILNFLLLVVVGRKRAKDLLFFFIFIHVVPNNQKS